MDYYWGLYGTTQEAGFKGEFALEAHKFNKKILIERISEEASPPSKEGGERTSSESAAIKNIGNNNIINSIITTINNTFNVNLIFEIILFSLLSLAAFKVVLDAIERRKKIRP